MDARVRQHIDLAPQKVPELLTKADHIEKRPVVIHVNEKIDVTIWSVVTAHDRAEHPDIPGAVSRRYPQYLVPVPIDGHGVRPTNPL